MPRISAVPSAQQICPVEWETLAGIFQKSGCEHPREAADEALKDYRLYRHRLGSERKQDWEFLLLPWELWPDSVKCQAARLRRQWSKSGQPMKTGDLLRFFGMRASLPRVACMGMLRELKRIGMDFEPDCRENKDPGPGREAVLPARQPMQEDELKYAIAQLYMLFAVSVAWVDDNLVPEEKDHLFRLIGRMKFLSGPQRSCLQEKIGHWMEERPGWEKQLHLLKKLGRKSQEMLLVEMAKIALADGFVCDQEVGIINRMATEMQIDPELLWARIRARTQSCILGVKKSPGSIRLDMAKVHSLETESDSIKEELYALFEEEDPIKDSPVLEGLSLFISAVGTEGEALVKLLLSKSMWGRNELMQAAAALGIMLDGMLEVVNEAAVDAFGVPFTDGFDPVMCTAEIREFL